MREIFYFLLLRVNCLPIIMIVGKRTWSNIDGTSNVGQVDSSSRKTQLQDFSIVRDDYCFHYPSV